MSTREEDGRLDNRDVKYIHKFVKRSNTFQRLTQRTTKKKET